MSRHLWQIQPVRDVLLGLGLFGLLVLGHRISIVTVPLLLAVVMAYLLEPLVQRMIRLKWVSRQGAALALLLVSGALVVVPVTVGAGFAVVQGVAFAEDLAQNLTLVRRSVDNPTDAAARDAVPEGSWRSIRDFVVLDPDEDPDEWRLLRRVAVAAVDYARANADSVARSLGRAIIGSGADAARLAISTVTSVGLFVFSVFLTGFFFFFVSTGWGRVLEFWQSLIPERRKGAVIDLVKQMDVVVSGFVRGRLTVCFFLAIFYTVGYAIVGVPAPLIMGPILGAVSLIPYISILGVPVAMLLMWLEPSTGGWQSSWWWILIAPGAVQLLSQVFDDYFLTPTIQGKATNMDTPTILFVSIAGGSIAGLYGILLAIPVAACLKIMIREVFWPPFRDWAQGKRSDPLPFGKAEREARPTSAS
ncbi:MAG TPA: hypothetical protein DEB06_10255 [Phycisphaerales bacterium]|nr:hypothetical protein [Phycisphaerales bacterium]